MKAFSITMGSLCAALFGLALYDQCKPEPTDAELACEAMRPQIAAFAELQAAKRAQLGTLAGPRVAQLGTRFAGIAIGEAATPEAIDRAQTITTPTPERPYATWVQDTKGIVTRVEIELGIYAAPACERSAEDPCACAFESDDRALCDGFARQLTAAWGPATDGAWSDPATGRRATLTGCTLVFE